jgi:CHAD domain-containing protein
MNARLLRKRWRRALGGNLERVGKRLRQRGALNANAVHELRVALRRSRLLLRLRGKGKEHPRIQRLRAAARTAQDAFAPVRDLDVALEWARTKQASSDLLSGLALQRAEACRRAENDLRRLRGRALRSGAAAKPDAEKLARSFERWHSRMRARSRDGAQRARQLTLTELHALRRDIRRWRYLHELLIPAGKLARDPTLATLVRVQERLGATQNAEVVVACLRRYGRSQEANALTRAARGHLAECREAALRELEELGGNFEP